MKRRIYAVPLVCFILLLSNLPGLCESDYVLVESIEILSGPTTAENNFVYIQENEKYLIRLELVFPPLPEKTFRFVSHLHGSVNIIEKNVRSRSGEVTFESKNMAETLTIELEGIAPKALVKLEGSVATSTDDRIVKGENEFSFFDIYADGIPVRLKYEEEIKVILSSSEILEAKKKINEAEEAIAKVELCSTSDLYVTKSMVQRMKNLLEIARSCLAEGAPSEALMLAHECLELAKIPVIKDQIKSLNYVQGLVEVDVAESSRFAHLALEELDKITEDGDVDACLSHIGKSEEYYSKATDCLISSINREVGTYELPLSTLILVLVALTGVILVLVFYIYSQGRERKIYDRGIEEGRKKAAEEELSARDIILGKGKEGGE